jgi:flagellar biosynthetic protein FliQ
MDVQEIVTLGQQTIRMALILSAPLLGSTLIAGLSISIFQALTQVHEIGLTFIVKIVTVAVVLFVFLPWLLGHLADYTTVLFEELLLI